MTYDLELIKTFEGDILPFFFFFYDLVNVIEKYVSQHRYFYQSYSQLFRNLIIEFRNKHHPHLLSLSKFHHFGFSTYRPVEIFNKLKEDWDLNYLISADESWYAENQDKLVGALLLYQLFHVEKCKVLTPKSIINTVHGKRFKRDNIYFVILKATNGKEYTIELSPTEDSADVFIPKSLKINDSMLSKCSELNLTFLKSERIVSIKKRKKSKK